MRALFVLASLAIVGMAAWPSASRAGDKPDASVVATSTVAKALSAQELELARWLDVLGNLDLYEDLECLELMSVLEDGHE